MRDEILKYYENLKSYYGTYHNHKEISAWAGLALYVVFVGVMNSIFSHNLIETKEVTAIIVTSLILLVLYLVFRYISTQLELKSMADNYTAAATFIITEIINNRNKDENELSKYVMVEESKDKKVKSSHFLPKYFIDKSKQMEMEGNKLKNRIKYMINGILIIVTLLVEISIWLKL